MEAIPQTSENSAGAWFIQELDGLGHTGAIRSITFALCLGVRF
jgi:hypothetical protein